MCTGTVITRLSLVNDHKMWCVAPAHEPKRAPQTDATWLRREATWGLHKGAKLGKFQRIRWSSLLAQTVARDNVRPTGRVAKTEKVHVFRDLSMEADFRRAHYPLNPGLSGWCCATCLAHGSGGLVGVIVLWAGGVFIATR